MSVEWNELQVIIHCTVLIRTYLKDTFILKLSVDTFFLGIYLFIYFVMVKLFFLASVLS